MGLVTVIGVDKDGQITKEHFGDNAQFVFYKITADKAVELKRVANSSGEEEEHAEPRKAQRIKEIISEAQIMVGGAIGPNIRRMRGTFVPVITRYPDIQSTLEALKGSIVKLEEALQQSEKSTIILDPKRA